MKDQTLIRLVYAAVLVIAYGMAVLCYKLINYLF